MKKIIKGIYTFFIKASDDSLAAYAAQITFFVLLSFFPFSIFVIMLTSKLSFSIDSVINQIIAIVPGELETSVMLIVNEIANTNATSISSFTIVSIIVSLWSAGKGIQALTYGLNKIYRVEKNKNFILLRLVSAIYTFIFALILLLIMVVHVFGSNIVAMVIEHRPSFAQATIFIYSLKSGFTFFILFLILLAIYYQLPGRRGRVKHEFTGAAFAALGWMFMTSVFSMFIKKFSSASYMYGSLTSIILIIMWLYTGMQIILYGAEINYFFSIYIEKIKAQRKNKKENILSASLVDTDKN